jgi:hypothetical protein
VCRHRRPRENARCRPTGDTLLNSRGFTASLLSECARRGVGEGPGPTPPR